MNTDTTHPIADLARHGFRRRMLATPAGAMAVYEAGRGRPLVFLHGIGGGASAWIWSKVAPAFLSTNRVVLPDWVGWGSSAHPRRTLLFGDYVVELEALLADLGQPAIVVAQSLAAGFVAEVARRHPEQVERLVLLTPSGGKDFGEDAFGPLARRIFTPIARRRPLNLAFYRLVFHRRSFVRGWLTHQGFAEPARVTDGIVNGFLYSARKPGAAYAALPFLSGDLRYDLAPYLRELTVPAAMIWGREERQVGLATGERLAAVNPDVALTVMEGVRATPELERPDETAALLSRLIAGASPSNLPDDRLSTPPR